MTLRAVISIGTNSTRLLVADLCENEVPQIVVARSIGTRIGQGLGDAGCLSDEAMQRTLAAVAEYAAAAGERTTDVSAISTSALRRAQNGAEFAARVRAVCDVPLHIVGGDEEARLSFLGAVAALDPSGSYGVLDVGGGSSEYATGSHDRVEASTSFEIGAVRLTERVPELAGASAIVNASAVLRGRAIARDALRPLSGFPRVDRMLLVGGSATTAAAMLRASRDPFERFPLSRKDLRRAVERIAELPLAARRRVAGLNPQRADIVLGGLLILETAMELCEHEAAIVSANDLLLGYLLFGRANV